MTWTPEDRAKYKTQPHHDAMDRTSDAANRSRTWPWTEKMMDSIQTAAHAEDMTRDIAKDSNPKVVFENGQDKLLISKSLDPKYDLRATNFDQHGPVGHREYMRKDIGSGNIYKDLTYEVLDAHHRGLTKK